jgi:predicted phosphodiesterase
VRYAVLSDIHGNMHALDAALDALADLGVTGYLCPGDLVGYGPMPNECVSAVAELDALCVAGNHDLIALGRLPDADCSEVAKVTLRWTKRHLDAAARRYLEQLPLVLATLDGVVMAHGSLRDPWEYVRTPAQRVRQLRMLAHEHPGTQVLILGHTHRPALHSARDGAADVRHGRTVRLCDGDAYLLNPGSVGQSRDRNPRARFAVLDTDRSEVTFHAVRFDVRACRRALRQQGLPAYAYQLRPPALRRYAGSLRRAARHMSGRFSRAGQEPRGPTGSAS